MEKNSILLVEDDETLGELLKSFLELNGFYIKLYRDSIKALEFFRTKEWNLCILDVMMPGMDGFTLAKEIKRIKSNQRFLFLTAKKLKEDMLKGFEIGAEDYIIKPFDSDLLLKKIEVILRRNMASPDAVETKEAYKFGNTIFKTTSRELVFEKATQKLSPKEGELMIMLCKNLGSIMLRSEALKKIWGEENFFTIKTMDVYMAKLRKYLEHDPSVKIENVHSKGFRIVG